MGGPGSGNRYSRFGTKLTVEESLAVELRDFREAIQSRSNTSSTLSWERGFYEHSVGLFLYWYAAGPIVILDYRWDDQEDVSIPVRLQTTPTNFDGRRWWFTCPLIAGGVACNRRE